MNVLREQSVGTASIVVIIVLLIVVVLLVVFRKEWMAVFGLKP